MKSANDTKDEEPIRFSVTIEGNSARLLREVIKLPVEPGHGWQLGFQSQFHRKQLMRLIRMLLAAGFAGLIRRGSLPSLIAADIRPENPDETEERSGVIRDEGHGSNPRFNISFGA
jgi:hypothetical protein